MKNQKLATRYARALLDALPSAEHQNHADRLLSTLAEAMAKDPDVKDALLDPAISREQKATMLGAIIDRVGGTPGLTDAVTFTGRLKNFMDVILEHGRAAAIPTIAEVFHKLKQEAQKIVAATVTTSEPLDHGLRERTEETLRRVTGRQVNVHYDIDPTLIGGMITRIGSTVYDGSLRSQLSRLKREMATN